jgi:penicillin-binding protein 1A
LRNYQPPVMSRVYSGDARLLAELATERRIFVPYSAIPDIVRQAFVSAEDQNFYTHRGVDPLAIARAALYNVTHMAQGRRPIGASTITQQVAKNMLLDNQMSVSRKMREAILAFRIEQNLPKDRILELYLNEIYLGVGSYGVAAAAQSYFNKSLDRLTLAEAAFLAALPKAPNNYNPFRFPEAARARRDWVLDRMTEDRVLTAALAATAKAEQIAATEFRRPPPVPGGEWFAEEVRRQLIAQFGQDTSTQGGLMVRTSLDPVLQLAAEKALRDGLVAYDRKLGGWRGAVTKLEGVALDRDWQSALGQVARPAGMPPNWTLAVVLGTTEQEAKLGWLDAGAQGAPQPRTGPMLLADVAWAKPMQEGKPGVPARRMAELMQAGDVVMIEPPAAGAVVAQPAPSTPPARGKSPAAPPPPPAARAVLRQIPTVQGALVSLDPATGRVLALVGGWSFEQSQFNRVTQAMRQPGSSFKPMVYLTALEKGISPSQRFLDAPIVIDTPAGRWRPGNYSGGFSGPVSMRNALEQSLNLVTLRIAQQIGMAAVADTAIRFHVVDSMPRVLPAALGAVESTVMRVAGAYASLAAGGREVLPTVIDSVQDRDGHVVWRGQGLDCETCADADALPVITDSRKQIADAASVFQLNTMLQGAVQRGTGMAAGKGLNRPIAGKTGTSQDFIDAWFAGFTPDLVTTVWVGFDTPTPLGTGETGGAVAAPIWRDFMAVALRNRPVLNFVPPTGVTMANWESGRGGSTDAFKPNQMPGASGAVGGVSTSSSGGGGGAGAGQGGVDSSLGGLY